MIPQSRISKYRRAKSQKSLRENVVTAKLNSKKTGFLCHSHKDAGLALSVQEFLNAEGWDIYIDWQDDALSNNPNSTTAKAIKKQISDRSVFLYLATRNASNSKWCPWEIGIADKSRGPNNVYIIPTSDSSGSRFGQEYLELYQRLSVSDKNRIAVYQPGSRTNGILLSSLS